MQALCGAGRVSVTGLESLLLKVGRSKEATIKVNTRWEDCLAF